MNDRFKFNAIVSSWYDIDTPEDYQEFEPKFYLKNVDVFCTGEIGIDYDTLLDAVKEQSKNLAEKEIGQIMQHFEDNSNSPECDFVTITPDKILQCTGLKDKNGKLIYEGDIVKVDKNTYADSCLLEQFENENAMITYREELGRYNIEFMPKDNSGNNVMDLMADFYYFLNWKPCGKLEYGILEYIEVIGNIYENKELLEEEC